MARYYYAGGERVAIEVDETRVAVDRARAEAAGLLAIVNRAAENGGSHLPGGVIVTTRSALDASELERLREARALGPVYRRDNALLIPLPEIRVEVDDAGQQQAVLASISGSPHPVEIAEDGPDRLVLVPTSGSGDHAIDVANFVFERAHPAAASARFVQLVPRPHDTKG